MKKVTFLFLFIASFLSFVSSNEHEHDDAKVDDIIQELVMNRQKPFPASNSFNTNRLFKATVNGISDDIHAGFKTATFTDGLKKAAAVSAHFNEEHEIMIALELKDLKLECPNTWTEAYGLRRNRRDDPILAFTGYVAVTIESVQMELTLKKMRRCVFFGWMVGKRTCLA